MKLTRQQFLKAAPFLALGSPLVGKDKEAPALVPLPKNFDLSEGSFRRNGRVAFNLCPGLDAGSVRLALPGFPLGEQPSSSPPNDGLRLVLEDPGASSSSPEAYALLVEQHRITVKSRSSSGLRMGLRTLSQLTIQGDIPQSKIVDWPDLASRSAHLCYHLVRESSPYNAPNFDALLEQIDQLAALKYNAVLLELEALFPFKKHHLLPAKIAFTPKQIAAISDRLRAHGMEVVPIVQCLGHAYNVLAHPEYREYAEVPGTLQQYCPTNPKLPDLYMDFVDEYLAAFPGIRQWHVGGDESWQLGECERCKEKVKRAGVSALYVDYIATISERLRSRGLQPLVWSDMMEAHPEAIGKLPKDIKIVYWNYDVPNWLRPYAVDLFLPHGLRVVGAPGVRFGGTGTDLAVYYPPALRGIETLIPRIQKQGTSEIMVTNWTKGSPHETTHYGFAYGADLCWTVAGKREDFQRRYARVAFGSDDPAICDVYETLSFRLPYAEVVASHQADRLNRYDLSGFRFPAKWAKYAAAGNEPKTIEELQHGLAGGKAATEALTRLTPGCTRGKRQLESLSMSASCVKAKAKLALALHEGRKLQQNRDRKGIEQWLASAPAIAASWQSAKEQHRRTLSAGGFEPVIAFLNDLLFEQAELDFFRKMVDEFQKLT